MLLPKISTAIIIIFGCNEITYGAEADLEKEQKALDIIGNFADRICTKIPLEGKGSNLQLSGQAKAELNNVFKQIADLGISGNSTYNAEKYQNVLRSELASSISRSDECRLKVFVDLKDKLLPSSDRDVRQKLLVELLHEDFNVRVNARWQLAQLGQTAVPDLTRIIMAYPQAQYKETLGALSAFAAMDKEICRRALNENPKLKDKIASISRETKDSSIKKRAADTLACRQIPRGNL